MVYRKTLIGYTFNLNYNMWKSIWNAICPPVFKNVLDKILTVIEFASSIFSINAYLSNKSTNFLYILIGVLIIYSCCHIVYAYQLQADNKGL